VATNSPYAASDVTHLNVYRLANMCSKSQFAVSSQVGPFFVARKHINEQQQRSACMYICY